MRPKQTTLRPHLNLPSARNMPKDVADYVESLRRQTEFYLLRIVEATDEQRGLRGTPTVLADVDHRGHRVTNLALPQEGSDAIRADLTLRRASPTTLYYDAGDLPIRGVARDTDVRSVVIREEVREVQDQVDTTSQDVLALRAQTQALQAQLDAINLSIANMVTTNTAQTVTGLKTFNTGAAPFAVTGTTLVANLNADLWDGQGYTSGSFAPTIVGYATPPTVTAQWVKVGQLVCLFIPGITGTSNATTFQVQGLPAAITPSAGGDVLVRVRDNSGPDGVGLVRFTAAGSNLAVYPRPATAPPTVETWTASGTKVLYAQMYTYYQY